MVRQRGLLKVASDSTVAVCSRCGEMNLERHEFYYNCKECNYQNCRACVLVGGKVLKRTMRFNLHKLCDMNLSSSNRHGSWSCDADKCMSGAVSYG